MMQRAWLWGVGLLLQALLVMPLHAQQSAGPATSPAGESGMVKVVLHTSQGDVELAVDPVHAPVTAANFLRYVDEKRFDGITFYRALKVSEDGAYGLVQGGTQGDPKRTLPTIAHESPKSTGLHNVDGAISMARAEPGTASGDFFIVIGDLTSLDGNADGSDPGYAVFGKVTSGMDVIKSMLDLPRSAEARDPSMKGQMLADPVKIFQARRVD